MSRRLANTIDGEGIYAVRAEQDKDGNQIDTTYAKKDAISEVPSTTGHNEGDVLTVDNNGDFGWAAPQGGSGSDYTLVNLAPTHVTSGDSIEIEVANKTLVTLDLNNVAETLENVKFVVPSVGEGEYLDIVIQIKPNSDDISVGVYSRQGGTLQSLPGLFATSGMSWFTNKWVQVKILGNLYYVLSEAGE